MVTYEKKKCLDLLHKLELEKQTSKHIYGQIVSLTS